MFSFKKLNINYEFLKNNPKMKNKYLDSQSSAPVKSIFYSDQGVSHDKSSKSRYFPHSNFLNYRKEMITAINKDKLATSFSELRELGSSLKSLIMQPSTLDEVLSEFEKKSQIKPKDQEISPNINEENPDFHQQTAINLITTSSISPLKVTKKDERKPKNLEILINKGPQTSKNEENDDLFEQRNEENIKKILGNLEVYLSSNLKEIKDFRDAMIKQEITQNPPNSNKFPDESYENTPLASNGLNNRAIFLKKIANIQEENVNNFINDLDRLNEEINLIENKANQLEINKLIAKIKTLSQKEAQKLQEIHILQENLAKLVENPEKTTFYARIQLSSAFEEEEIQRNTFDYMLSFEYKPVILIINEETIAFRERWTDSEVFFQFEYASISEIIEIFNNKASTSLFLPEERKNEEKTHEFQASQFSGFQIKFWSEGSLKVIFLRSLTFDDFRTLDEIFFVFNLRRNVKSNEFLYKNQKHHFFFSLDPLQSFSQTSIPKIQSNFNIDAEKIQSEGNSPSKNDKKSIITLENGQNMRKKKAIHFQINENKSNTNINNMESSMRYSKIEENSRKHEKIFNPEANFQTYIEETENFPSKQRDNAREIDESKRKLQEIEEKDQEISKKKEAEMREGEYRMLKARKLLVNGYIFLKYGKMGDPHERFVSLNAEKQLLECKAFDFKTKNKKIFEIGKLNKVEFGRMAPNFQRIYKGNSGGKDNENLCFSLVFQGNKRLDLEAESEEIKRNFLDNFEILVKGADEN